MSVRWLVAVSMSGFLMAVAACKGGGGGLRGPQTLLPGDWVQVTTPFLGAPGAYSVKFLKADKQTSICLASSSPQPSAQAEQASLSFVQCMIAPADYGTLFFAEIEANGTKLGQQPLTVRSCRVCGYSAKP